MVSCITGAHRRRKEGHLRGLRAMNGCDAGCLLEGVPHAVRRDHQPRPLHRHQHLRRTASPVCVKCSTACSGSHGPFVATAQHDALLGPPGLNAQCDLN